MDELRSQDWVPRSVRDKAKMLDRSIIELEAELGRSPDDEEVAAKIGLSMEEFYDLVNDPHELTNLIDDPASAEIRKVLEEMIASRPDDMRPVQVQVGIA